MYEIRSHLKVLQNIEDYYDMGDVVVDLFDNEVECIYKFKEDHVAVAVYRFPDGCYSWIDRAFGSCSGCDEWIDSYDVRWNESLERIVKDLELNMVDEIYKITFLLETGMRYYHRELKNGWIELLNSYGEGYYEKCLELAKERDLEYEKKVILCPVNYGTL
jgi:hypothetical protein